MPHHLNVFQTRPCQLLLLDFTVFREHRQVLESILREEGISLSVDILTNALKDNEMVSNEDNDKHNNPRNGCSPPVLQSQNHLSI